MNLKGETMNKKQFAAVKKLFNRNPDGCETFYELSARAHPEIGFPDTYVIYWCGMTVGIEPDGHTHT
jgi:hypothetical protein